MKTGKRKIYWDSSCWLAWLNGEGLETWPADVVDGIRDVVIEIESGATILFTSSLSRTEVPIERLNEIQKEKYAKLLRRSNVMQVDPTVKVFDRAAQIREFHAQQIPKRSVLTPDAIHLATAIIYGADEFQTMDGLQTGGSRRKLLALTGNVGGYDLKVVPPYKRNMPPPELVSVRGPLFKTSNGKEDELDEQQATDASSTELRGSIGDDSESEAGTDAAEGS